MKKFNKQILEMLIKQKTSGDTERTYMTMQSMYLKLQVMDQNNHTRKKIIEAMVQTTSGEEGSGRITCST